MNHCEQSRLRILSKYAVLDTPPEPNFDRITSLAADIFGTPVCTLAFADADRHFFKSHHGVDATEMPRRMSFCDQTILGDDPFVVSDALGDARFREAPVVAGPPHFRFYAGVPLVAPKGPAIGTLCVLDVVPRTDFDTGRGRILGALAATAMELLEARWRQIELAKCTAEIAHLARHDPLTGLANRRLLDEHMEQALREGGRQDQIAVLYLDLDRFKPVNDTYGHKAGDALLQEVAARLRAGVRETDHIARMGGDEFAVVLAGPQVQLQAADIADRLVSSIGRPYALPGGQVVEIGVSIGIALGGEGARGASFVEAMFREADLALYQAKSQGRSCFRFFDAGTAAHVV